jgi:molybdopterin-binding protein
LAAERAAGARHGWSRNQLRATVKSIRVGDAVVAIVKSTEVMIGK